MAKKIGAIVSLSIIGVLIIATIIMANIKIDYSINCATPHHIYVNNVEAKTEQANKIVSYVNNASNQNSLYALFNGNLGNKAEIVSTGNKSLSTSGYTITYAYNTPQTLMDGNKEYKNSKGIKVTYERLVFSVANVEGETDVKVYVIPDSLEPSTYTYYYLLEADFSELYSYLSTNF